MSVEISASTQLTDTLVFEGLAPTDPASWRPARITPGGWQCLDKRETQVILEGAFPACQFLQIVEYKDAEEKAIRLVLSSLTSPEESSKGSRQIIERTDVEESSVTTMSQTTYESAESSTAQEKSPVGMIPYIESLFRSASEERFEDGAKSEFSRELTLCVREYGIAAVTAIAELIISEKVDAEVACEALRSLGEMRHPPSYGRRLRLLERSLRCSSPWVRDGAALGLAWLDDPVAIPHLREAVERENFDDLRQDIRQVLAQLEATRSCHWL